MNFSDLEVNDIFEFSNDMYRKISKTTAYIYDVCCPISVEIAFQPEENVKKLEHIYQ